VLAPIGIGIPAAVAAVMIAMIRLAGRAIDNRDTWRRFLVFVFIALAIVLAIVAATVWWLFYCGGLEAILHAIGPASIAQPHGRPG
jgi:hypothetical protein